MKKLTFYSVSTSVNAFIARLFLILAIACSFAAKLQAQAVNPKISIQGTLKSANGSSVVDGSYEVTFRLYTTPTGGTPVWSEDATVDVIGAIYSHYLGSVTPLIPSTFANPLFLGVKVGSYELIPRSELAYSPYAFSVAVAQKVVCSGAVGDVKYSILNPTQFAQVNGDCWVPMDGRAMATTDVLRTITSMTNVPNGGGLFLRSQEFSGGADNDPSRTSASPIASLQADAVQTHGHHVDDPGHTHEYEDHYYETGGVNHYVAGGGERYSSDNFIKPVHISASNTTGVTVTSTGNGPETRPKNLNFWVYIRIN